MGGWNRGQVAHNAGKGKPECNRKVLPTMLDIAWSAGIYEGEGYCQVRPYQRGIAYQIVTRVAQKDAWLCPRLQELWGGTVRTYSAKCCSPHDPELRRTYHCWDLQGTRALEFLQTIYMFLSPRRQGQIKEVLLKVRRQEN